MINDNFIFEVEEDSKDEVIIESEKFKKKIEEYKKYDKSTLLVLADFDYTFTRKTYKNKTMLSSYNVVERSKIVPESFLNECQKLSAKYKHYERDTSSPIDFRIKMMEEWYDTELHLMIDMHFSKRNFYEFVEEANVNGNFIFRKGLKKLFNILYKYKIPIIIVSAGLFQIVNASLKKLLGKDFLKHLINENLLIIIANRFIYNEDEVIIDRVFPVIHSFNKKDVTNQAVEQLKKQNGNFIVLGDAVQDIFMVNNSKYNNLLGIAFDNHPEKHENFLEHYDAVISNDGDFTFINRMINTIMEH